MDKEEIQRKLQHISEQVSSGKMTINQARESLGLKRNEDGGKSDIYIIEERFCKEVV